MNSFDCITFDAELPGAGGEIWYYPPGDHEGQIAQSRRVVRVRAPGARTWYGVFAAGVMGCDGAMQFANDSGSFVIVHRGAGYRVELGDPSRWRELMPTLNSITHMQYFQSIDTLVLLSAGTLTASGYNACGHAWTTSRLVLDDLDFVCHDDETLTVSGDHGALGEGMVQIILRARDGKVLSGQSFSWEDRILHRVAPVGDPDAR